MWPFTRSPPPSLTAEAAAFVRFAQQAAARGETRFSASVRPAARPLIEAGCRAWLAEDGHRLWLCWDIDAGSVADSRYTLRVWGWAMAPGMCLGCRPAPPTEPTPSD